MDSVDIGTLRAGIGIFIGMIRKGLGSFSEKMKGYRIGSVFYACPAYLVIAYALLREYICLSLVSSGWHDKLES